MSMVPVVIYIAGITVFGFLYWILDNVRMILMNTGIGLSGNTANFLYFCWGGSIIIYLIFGAMYVIRKYNEQEYQGWSK